MVHWAPYRQACPRASAHFWSEKAACQVLTYPHLVALSRAEHILSSVQCYLCLVMQLCILCIKARPVLGRTDQRHMDLSLPKRLQCCMSTANTRSDVCTYNPLLPMMQHVITSYHDQREHMYKLPAPCCLPTICLMAEATGFCHSHCMQQALKTSAMTHSLTNI